MAATNFMLKDFDEGIVTEIWATEVIDGHEDKVLVMVVKRAGDKLVSQYTDEDYTIGELNALLLRGEEWSKKEYGDYKCLGYSAEIAE